MNEIINDQNLVAFCGLYCGACPQYLKGKCDGCQKNVKATWCKLRICCMDNNFKSCAECKDFEDINKCKKFNNIFSKFFALVFGSDRKGCIDRIKEIGIVNFTKEMAENKTFNKVKE